MLCTKCDADIGTGVNSNKHVCLSFCDEWFLACAEDYIDAYVDPSTQVPFCREESMVCSPAHEVTNHSRGFCEYMGYKVMGPEEYEQSLISNPKPVCFNGIPRQLNEIGKILRTDAQRSA